MPGGGGSRTWKAQAVRSLSVRGQPVYKSLAGTRATQRNSISKNKKKKKSFILVKHIAVKMCTVYFKMGH